MLESEYEQRLKALEKKVLEQEKYIFELKNRKIDWLPVGLIFGYLMFIGQQAIKDLGFVETIAKMSISLVVGIAWAFTMKCLPKSKKFSNKM